MRVVSGQLGPSQTCATRSQPQSVRLGSPNLTCAAMPQPGFVGACERPSTCSVVRDAPLACLAILSRNFYASSSGTHTVTRLDDLLLRVLDQLDPIVLTNTLGVGKNGRPLERSWQMAFYQACMAVLPSGVVVSPDVGKVSQYGRASSIEQLQLESGRLPSTLTLCRHLAARGTLTSTYLNHTVSFFFRD